MTDETPKTYTEAQVQELIQTRTSELRDSRNTLTAELAELRPAAAAWETKAGAFQAELASVSDVVTQFADLQAKHADAATGWGQERVLLGAGISDPDVGDVLRAKFSKATEPGEFSEWFEREGRSSPLVSAFLSPQAAAPTLQTGEAPAPPAPTSPQMPNANAGRKPAPPAAQAYTPGSISSMSIEEFRRNKDSLMNGVKIPV
jgi:hypothetical protein